MELFGERNLEKQEPIIFSFEFDARRDEQREEYQGIDVTFWTTEFQEKGKVDIKVNVSSRRGERKELDGMKVVLKQYGKIVSEGVVEGGFAMFKNMEKGIYTVEFMLKEIQRNKYFDTYVV